MVNVPSASIVSFTSPVSPLRCHSPSAVAIKSCNNSSGVLSDSLFSSLWPVSSSSSDSSISADSSISTDSYDSSSLEIDAFSSSFPQPIIDATKINANNTAKYFFISSSSYLKCPELYILLFPIIFQYCPHCCYFNSCLFFCSVTICHCFISLCRF